MGKECSEVKVSVVVPVYNVENYLKECLESLINQTFQEFEILCVDDGSTDNSLSILQEYAAMDKRIKVFHQENTGQGVARNFGIKQAVGKYICFVDSDDMLKESALERLYVEAENTDVDVITFNTNVIYEDSKLEHTQNHTNYYKRNGIYEGIYQGKELFSQMVEQKDYIHSAWLLFINREWMQKNSIAFMQGIIYEDVFFTLNVFFRAERFLYIVDKLYIYRVRYHSTLNLQLERNKCIHSLKSYLTVYKELQRLIRDENSPDVKKALMSIGYDFQTSIRKIDTVIQKEGIQIENDDIDIKYLADELGLGCFTRKYQYDKSLYLDGFNYRVAKAKTIVLYGSGEIGRKTLCYLRKKGWDNKVLAFAVSVPVEEKVYVESKPQKYIEELLNNTQIDLIILSAKYEYQLEMIRVLEKYNYDSYVAVDINLERIMNNEIIADML